MSQRHDPQRPNYTLDDILKEFGSGADPTPEEQPQTAQVQAPEPQAAQPQAAQPQTPPDEPTERDKVVQFPHRPPQARPNTPPAHSRGKRSAPMPDISPVNPLRQLGARLSTLRRRADHFAEHMYDQAEPDSETVKVETYLPGVDREEPPARPVQQAKAAPKKPARVKPVKPPPPDIPPADLAVRYQRGLKTRRRRVGVGWVLVLASILLSVPLPIPQSVSQSLPLTGVSVLHLKVWALCGLLAILGLLCLDVLVVGFSRLVRLRPRGETLVALAWLFTLLDSLTFALWPQRGEALPCCAVTALGLNLAMWGRTLRQQGDRLSAKAAGQTSTPYVVSLDEDKWNHRPAYSKWRGTPRGVGSQLQMEDGAQKAWSIAAPLLLLGCVACALLSSVSQQQPQRLLWAASAVFTASASYPTLLAFSLPYQKVASRLFKSGAAVAGWTGVQRCRHGGLILTDTDLFPPGAVQVTHFELYHNTPKEKAVSYTATLLKAAECGLTQPFYKLLQSTGALYREVTGVRFHEGGVSGIIHNHEILVGTSDFMHLLDIPLPRSLKVKHAIYCAVDGQLAAMFPVTYSLPSAVRPSLATLLGLNVTPILATRDPNLIPALLTQKFKLPGDRMEFPDVDRRRELSDPQQPHSSQPAALLSREGLGVFCDAVVGCRRLRLATHMGVGFSLAGAVLGLIYTFFLTYSGSYQALSAVNFLVFMTAWLVPQLLLAGWVNQY